MSADTDTIDRLFLELSQFTKATTGKEMALTAALLEANDICRSAYQIAERGGADTNWSAFQMQVEAALKVQHAILHPSKKEVAA